MTTSFGPQASDRGRSVCLWALKSVDDLIWDLEQGFARVAAAASSEAATR